MRFAIFVSAILLSGSALAAAPAAPAAPAAGDVARGEKRFKAICGACHTLDPAKKSIGPHLKGVVGRKAGTVAGFAYSVGMKNSGITWDTAILDPYLTRPGNVVKGTKMINMVANAKDRSDIIAYLATVK